MYHKGLVLHSTVPLSHQHLFCCVSNSCFSVISERFSSHPGRKCRLSWDFFDRGKRLRSTRRVQSRSRGTRTIPYVYWGSECQSERAPAWRENAFWCCVLDSSRHRCRVIVRRNERMKEFEGGRRPTEGTVESRKRGTDTLPKGYME